MKGAIVVLSAILRETHTSPDHIEILSDPNLNCLNRVVSQHPLQSIRICRCMPRVVMYSYIELRFFPSIFGQKGSLGKKQNDFMYRFVELKFRRQVNCTKLNKRVAFQRVRSKCLFLWGRGRPLISADIRRSLVLLRNQPFCTTLHQQYPLMIELCLVSVINALMC